MIPQFPKFKKLSIKDGAEIRRFSHRFQPYSLFNFSCLWAWNTEGMCKVSKLNGNLVILYTDFITAKPFISFFGTNKSNETAYTLLKFAKGRVIPPSLRFISEEVKVCLKHTDFHIEEDRENFDYIFSTSSIAQSLGAPYKQKRQLVHKFTREYPNAYMVQENLRNPDVKSKLTAVIRQWEKNKINGKKQYSIEHEEKAIGMLLKKDKNSKLVLSCVYIGEIMIGFSIDEMLPGGFAMAHFIKADYSYKGVSEFLNEKVAQYLLERGVELWNWQQDLNFDGLRKLKMSYHPVRFLKTYSISKNS